MRSVGQRAANGLVLAASPVFGVMALLVLSQDASLCSMTTGAPWNSMAAMYLLMSAAHLPPWFKFVSGRWNARAIDDEHARKSCG